MTSTAINAALIASLERVNPLDDEARGALLALPFSDQHVDAGQYLVREGSPLRLCTFLVEGFAFQHKVTVDGCRQIVSFHIPGDLFGLEGSVFATADHSVQALVRSRVASVPAEQMNKLVQNHPTIGKALWTAALIEASVFREWVLNVGRRDAKRRIAHLFCEIGMRLELAGLGTTTGFEVPLTQEHLADATGLTPVHVNRSIKALEAEGLLYRNRQAIRVPNWARLSDYAGFNALYLHIPQSERVPRPAAKNPQFGVRQPVTNSC